MLIGKVDCPTKLGSMWGKDDRKDESVPGKESPRGQGRARRGRDLSREQTGNLFLHGSPSLLAGMLPFVHSLPYTPNAHTIEL